MSPETMPWLIKARSFEKAAHEIFAAHEAATNSRVIQLEDTYGRLSTLSLKQDDLFRQSLRCAESGLNRAAHVMAWAALMDLIEEALQTRFSQVRYAYPKWKGADIHEMAEYVPERQLVEALKLIGLASKNQVNALVGLLQRRNECAHPTEYLPGTNETLGYISEILQRVSTIASKVATSNN